MSLIIVSNRLPITASIKDGEIGFKHSVGGLTTGLSTYIKATQTKIDCLWIGWPGISISKEHQEDFKEDFLKPHNYHPVFLDNEHINSFYLGFCNNTLWPLFHYFPQEAEFESAFWEQYIRVNELFASVILDVVKLDDTVWIHDYHLMLLPSLIRKKHPNIKIGYFHHIPFPSEEVFRLLKKSWRTAILGGLLGADVIGFHIKEYVDHFNKCVLEVSGSKLKKDRISYTDRLIKVNTFPMGIDYNLFHHQSIVADRSGKISDFKKSFDNNKLILSIDRLDYSKGLINKLVAFEQFLEQYPKWIGNLSFILVVVPSRTGLHSYKKMKQEIDQLVGRINGKFSSKNWLPISYQYNQFDIEELVLLYSSCDVALVTPLRDGMNLIAKEFIASRFDQTGVLILSEFAGASKELLEAEIVNPFIKEEIVLALYGALNMTKAEQIRRNKAMQSRLQCSDIFKWVGNFLSEVETNKQAFSHHYISDLVE